MGILNNSPANMAIFFALEQGLLSCEVIKTTYHDGTGNRNHFY
jgi:hypothetical protein